jgi:site-specific recombinase XerD
MSQDQFTTELKYIRNVSPGTLNLYKQSFKHFAGTLDTKEAIIRRVGELRDRGVKAVSVNTYLRCINVYFHWRDGKGEKCCPQCTHIRIPKLKEEQLILATFTPQHVKALLDWRPKHFAEVRLHTLVCLYLDTGLRLSEALGLAKTDVDLENLVLKVKGKGGKHRLVPISVECRKVLYRWNLRRDSATQHASLNFCTLKAVGLSVRNFERDFKELCNKLNITGIRCSPHTLRHTFAVGYLRAGGNLFYLSRILGHTNIKTTQRYLQSLGIEDLQAVHSRLSLLGSR